MKKYDPTTQPFDEPFRHVDRGLPVMYTIHINGDNSDADYTGVSKIATLTGYEWRIVGPLAEALKRHEDTYRDKIAALEADAIAARKQVMTLRGVK